MVEIEHATIEVRDLAPCERTEMFLLMQKYYWGVNRETFERDLSEKEHVMLLRHRADSGCVVGFSTLMRFEMEIAGHPVMGIFSGDTVVEERCRRSRGLAYEITQYFIELVEASALPLYYILICKGWRTYRILPFLFHQFSPRFDQPTEALHQQVMDAFGAQRYPREYSSEKGLIVFERETQRIKENSAEEINPLRRDRHINFFAQKNPNHARGDELVCVAPVARWNFTEAFHKLLESRYEVCGR